MFKTLGKRIHKVFQILLLSSPQVMKIMKNNSYPSCGKRVISSPVFSHLLCVSCFTDFFASNISWDPRKDAINSYSHFLFEKLQDWKEYVLKLPEHWSRLESFTNDHGWKQMFVCDRRFSSYESLLLFKVWELGSQPLHPMAHNCF